MSDDDRMDTLLRQMAAEDYNRPPQIVPREQMWEAILEGTGKREQGAGKATGLPFVRRVPRWVYLAVAAALLLAVGIQVGRLLGPAASIQGPAGSQMAEKRDSLGSDGATRGQPEDVVPGGAERVANVPRSDDGGRPKPGPRPGGPERQVVPDLGDDGASRAYTLVAAQHLTQVEMLLTAFKGDLNQGRMDTQMASWGKELLSNTRLLLDSPVAADPLRRKLLQDLELVLVQIVQLSPGASARDRDLIKGALTDDQVLMRLRTAIPSPQGT